MGEGGWVGELRGVEAQLLVWSARVEVVGKGWATVSLRLAGVRWAAMAFWASGAGKRRVSEWNRMWERSGG